MIAIAAVYGIVTEIEDSAKSARQTDAKAWNQNTRNMTDLASVPLAATAKQGVQDYNSQFQRFATPKDEMEYNVKSEGASDLDNIFELIVIACQLAVGVWIWGVWTWRLRAQTSFRGLGARSLEEEFAVYGFGKYTFMFVGFVKLACATGMIVSTFIPTALYNNMLFPCFPEEHDGSVFGTMNCTISFLLLLVQPVAALGLCILMAVAMWSHYIVKDPLTKYIPAFCMGTMSAIVLFFSIDWLHIFAVADEDGVTGVNLNDVLRLRIPPTGFHYMLTRVFLGALAWGCVTGWWFFAWTLNAYDLNAPGMYGLLVDKP